MHFSANASINESQIDADLPDLRSSVISGMKSGVIGGLLMAVFLLLIPADKNGHGLLPTQVLINVSGKTSALISVSAVILHFVFSVIFGAIFGLIMAKIIGRVGVFTALIAGGTYGLWIWIFSQYVIFPAIMPEIPNLFDHQSLAVAYLIFGSSLALFGTAYRVLPGIFQSVHQIYEFRLKPKHQ